MIRVAQTDRKIPLQSQIIYCILSVVGNHVFRQLWKVCGAVQVITTDILISEKVLRGRVQFPTGGIVRDPLWYGIYVLQDID